MGADCSTVFVAANLSRLPPLSLGNYDVLSVVHDVENLKASMGKMLQNQQVMSDLLVQQTKTIASGIQHNVLPSVQRSVSVFKQPVHEIGTMTECDNTFSSGGGAPGNVLGGSESYNIHHIYGADKWV